MIKLVISDSNSEGSELEKALIKNGIEFQVMFDLLSYGLEPPHLIVDGVPLDEKHSFKWIESHSNNGI